ncbi:zinc finger protein 182 [Folsomia candida]|uniref:zinc finger protein 182 n=1 Tax=Folsomia candida TaxID=158441 RepID=UPI000B8F79D0|nr:zinc finger protein 182 [Folsomia candida]
MSQEFQNIHVPIDLTTQAPEAKVKRKMGFKPGMNREGRKCSKTVESDKNCAPQRPVTHDSDKKAKCEICSKSPSTLCTHIENLHTNQERPKGDIAHQASSSTTNLPNDVEAVHSTKKERPRFPCTFPGCEKSYLSKSKVAKHYRTQHSENPVRFRCTVCEKKFKTKADLGRHSSTQTNAKPHKCAICGGRFAHKAARNRHQTIHLEKSARESFKCQFCPTTSFRRSNLQIHIRLIHENQRNYPCSLCEKKLSSVQDFKRHVAVRHSENKGTSTAIRVQKPLEK